MPIGTYIGKLPHLIGKVALLRQPPEDSFVLAQFDDASLTRSGAPIQPPSTITDEPHESLGYGWHVFKKDDFSISERDMPQFYWPEDEDEDEDDKFIPLARPRTVDESTPLKPWIVPQPHTATSTARMAAVQVSQGDAFSVVKHLAKAKRDVAESMSALMPVFGSASEQLSSLIGMLIVITEDQPRYQLPDDVCVPADFRREFNEWARGFYTPINRLADGETLIAGNGMVYMNPRTYEALKATFARFDINLGFK